MSTMMPVEIKVGRTDRESDVSVSGVSISGVRKYSIAGEAGELTTIKLDLIALQPMTISGDTEVEIGIDEIPENLAFEIYQQLEKRFSKERLKRKIRS